MSKKKKVMVIGHDASLSGAPVLLLNLFKLLIEREIVDVQFVLRRGGPLAEAYKHVAPVIVLKQPKFGEEKNVLLRTAHWVESRIKLLQVLFKAFSCDYLFFNTVVNGRLLRWLRLYHKPVATYVHEFEKIIDLYLRTNDAVLPLSISDVIVYPSHATRDLLLDKYGIPDHKLKKLSYFFPFREKDYDPYKAVQLRKNFRGELDINDTDFLVGAVGTVSERKGVDLFIDVCEKVVSVNTAVKFVWIGSFESEEQEVNIRKLIEEKQLGQNLFFTGPLYYDVFNFSPLDIFFLSSREDTYPLVVLEAAMMRIPSICFSGSGGIIEFIADDAGWIIDDFSTRKAADQIIGLESIRDAVHFRGNIAFEKVISLHCNADKIIGQYNDAILHLLSKAHR